MEKEYSFKEKISLMLKVFVCSFKITWSFLGGLYAVLIVVAIPALISSIIIGPLAKLLSIYDFLENTMGLTTLFWLFLTFIITIPLYFAFKSFMTEERFEKLNKFFREKLKSPLPWDEFWDVKKDKTKTPSS